MLFVLLLVLKLLFQAFKIVCVCVNLLLNDFHRSLWFLNVQLRLRVNREFAFSFELLLVKLPQKYSLDFLLVLNMHRVLIVLCFDEVPLILEVKCCKYALYIPSNFPSNTMRLHLLGKDILQLRVQ